MNILNYLLFNRSSSTSAFLIVIFDAVNDHRVIPTTGDHSRETRSGPATGTWDASCLVFYY